MKGASYRRVERVTVILTGEGQERTIQLQVLEGDTSGSLFIIGANITSFVLDKDITLKGVENISSGPTGAKPLVSVRSGDFEMREGAKITGNYRGEGVCVERCAFTMSGGESYGNRGRGTGGGVYATTFTMSGGKIYGNTGSGGGVYATTFTMTGGEIYGNTASISGGGVYAYTTFTKTGGGIIRGYSAGDTASNKVINTAILLNEGHAVYVNSSKRCEATVDESHDLDSNKDGAEGGWDV